MSQPVIAPLTLWRVLLCRRVLVRRPHCHLHVTRTFSVVQTGVTYPSQHRDARDDQCVNQHKRMVDANRGIVIHQSQKRHFSSRGGNSGFQLDALTFTVSPEEAQSGFQEWATHEQGLSYGVSNVRIGASYVPVWSFDLNIRFVTWSENNRRRFDWKPEPFASAFGPQPKVIHVPGMAAYAGFTYRRSLINPIHNTALVFLGQKTVPFQTWMLRDMEYFDPNTGQKQRLEIFPDPWNATKGKALNVVKEELQDLVSASTSDNVEVQTQVVHARRVYMPTYVVDYSILGLEYRAFVSGCDAGQGVSGVSHKILSSTQQDDLAQVSSSFLSQAASAAQASVRVLGVRNLGTFALLLVNLLANIVGRIAMRVPLIGVVGGLFVGFRKVVQPWMSDQWASAEWERQRQHDAETTSQQQDDFIDTTGAARRYFETHRSFILKTLGGQHTHEQGEYDWYKEWEEWARRQFDQQRQQTYQQQQQQQRQQQAPPRSTRKTKKRDFKWDFDPNDPYSVLGVSRGATKDQVSAAFRKEMLKHHPDVQSANASEAEKERSMERSKLITEAYRKIKAERK